jgi:(p)ppGpp synthase/HD superfamily hydrolase
LQENEAVALGKRLLDRNLSAYSLNVERVPQQHIDSILVKFKLESIDNLLSDIGLGNRMPLIVAKQIMAQMPEIEKPSHRKTVSARQFGFKGILHRYVPSWLKTDNNQPKPLAIKGTEGIVVNYAKCCRPIPGDPITGIFSAGKGIVIHTKSCSNIREYKKHPENILELTWEENAESVFPVEIRVQVADNKGVLATVAAVISEQESNIENISIDDHDSKHTELVFVINVSNRLHLANVMRQIKLLEQVEKISRTKG